MEGALEALGAGEELETGIFAAVGGGVEASFGGFFLHGLGGCGKGDVDADLGALALEDSDEVADYGITPPKVSHPGGLKRSSPPSMTASA